MVLDVIALGVLILSLIGLAVVIFRKFPTLAAANPSSMSGSIAERKHSLIEERLRRKFTTFGTKMADSSAPARSVINKFSKQAYQKLQALEHEYRIRALPVFLTNRQRRKVDAEITNLLTQAQVLIDDKEFAAAEEKAMQAVRYEPRSVPTFEFLGELYLETKEYTHAKEVYRYLLKLQAEADAIHTHDETQAMSDQSGAAAQVQTTEKEITYLLNLARIDRYLGEWTLALERIQDVARFEPNNPKVLDEYIAIAIGAGKKQFAQDAVTKLHEVNPENSKISEWQEQIDAMTAKPIAGTEDPSALTNNE